MMSWPRTIFCQKKISWVLLILWLDEATVKELDGPPWFFSICHYLYFNACPIPTASILQEPMLALPASFLGRMQSIPQEARILPAVKPAKRKDYLSVAQALLQTHQTEATRRSVNFLIEICRTSESTDVPRLAWLEDEPDVQRVQVGLPSAFARVAPAMRFKVTLRP